MVDHVLDLNGAEIFPSTFPWHSTALSTDCPLPFFDDVDNDNVDDDDDDDRAENNDEVSLYNIRVPISPSSWYNS